MSSIVIATKTANVSHQGGRIHIHAGSAWDGSDPVVAAYPDMFTDDPRALNRSEPVVEAATAAPGERRARVGARSRKAPTDTV